MVLSKQLKGNLDSCTWYSLYSIHSEMVLNFSFTLISYMFAYISRINKEWTKYINKFVIPQLHYGSWIKKTKGDFVDLGAKTKVQADVSGTEKLKIKFSHFSAILSILKEDTDNINETYFHECFIYLCRLVNLNTNFLFSISLRDYTRNQWMEFSGPAFKSHSGQLSIATSKILQWWIP